jgi:tripartite-type tricarboxylate transporter receptor subunit TctC
MIRRIAIAVVLAGAAFAGSLVGLPASAQGKPTRIIVAFPAGGPVDFVARVVAEQLSKEIGQSVIVENKPGGNGAIAAQTVMQAPADGTTLWLTSVGAAAINPGLYEKLAYDMQRDFAPVSRVVDNDEILVVDASNPAKDAAQFVANAKSSSTPVAIASTGIGSIPHLAMEQLADATKGNFLHVPYKGAAPAVTDIMGGQVAAFFGDIPGLVGHIKGGRLKALGIAASKRSPVLPGLATLAEQGLPGVDSNNWYALFVPAKTPAATIAALNAAVRRVLAVPAVSEKLVASGTVPAPSTPEELTALLKRDTQKWGALIKAKNIRPEG